MSWIFLTVAAQFINALVAIGDKYLVTDTKALPKPFVYAFYTCIVTVFWVLIYPFGLLPGVTSLGVPQLTNVMTPSLLVIATSLLSAYTFFIAILAFYEALKSANTSDVMPVVGATSAVVSFVLSWSFLDIDYPNHFIFGILLLVGGTLMVSKMRLSLKAALVTISSGIFFAFHYLTMKILFTETNFDDGFFWSRLALIVVAMSFLLFPGRFESVFGKANKVKQSTGWFVLVNKVMAGVAALLILKATDWGDVAVIQALDGLKFVFILIIAFVFDRFMPMSVREEKVDLKTTLRKIFYVFIICLGFFILFI